MTARRKPQTARKVENSLVFLRSHNEIWSRADHMPIAPCRHRAQDYDHQSDPSTWMGYVAMGGWRLSGEGTIGWERLCVCIYSQVGREP